MQLILLQWLQETFLASAIRETRWSMPIFLIFHALGITFLLGTVIIVNLRLLGVVMPDRPVSEIAAQIWRWSLFGLLMMITSGMLLFIPEPLRWYHSTSFWLKMTFLSLAIIFHFTAYRKVTQKREPSLLVGRACAAISLLLWYAVAVGGRALTIE